MNDNIEKLIAKSSYVLRETKKSNGSLNTFLRTVANNYRFNIYNIALIHSEVPTAKVVLSSDQWKVYGRTVKKFAPPIALLNKEYNRYILHYNFERTYPLSDGKSHKTIKIFNYYAKDKRVADAVHNYYGADKSISLEKAISDGITYYNDNSVAKELATSMIAYRLTDRMNVPENTFIQLAEMTDAIYLKTLSDALKIFRSEFVTLYDTLSESLPIIEESAISNSDLNIELIPIGDFYEVRGEQARNVAQVLKLHITARLIDNERIPIVGFPKYKIEDYTNLLEQAGYTINFPVVEDSYNEEVFISDNVKRNAMNADVSAVDNLSTTNTSTKNESAIKVEKLTQADIDEILRYGSNFARTKARVYKFFNENKKTNEQANFLKKEYGTGGCSFETTSGKRFYLSHSPKGLSADEGYGYEFRFTYKQAAKRIVELINANAYMSQSDLEDYLKLQIEATGNKESKISNDNIKFSYSVGSSVTLNSTEYVVTAIDKDTVIAAQENSPLFSQTFDKEHFEKLLYQDAYANRLLISTEPANDKTVSHNEVLDESTSGEVSPISTEGKIDYKILSPDLGIGTPAIRYKNNITAIKLLKKLEKDSRSANNGEQEILNRYVGWGGLADRFEREDSIRELKQLLSDNEFNSAKSSTLTAFYTPPAVIKGIYDTLENIGFEGGKILDPACGTGHFFGLIPDEVKENSTVYGVEIDTISGNIAKQLYPSVNITVDGFENINIADNTIDVAVGNVPFGNFKVFDKQYNKHHLMIHDYFFVKTLDKVRPGGVVAFITSKGTLDKKDTTVRKMLAEKAELLGAVRLPNNTFKGAAGTEVTSDILFLQKRDQPLQLDKMPDWVETDYNSDGIVINNYYISHPGMICGKMEMQSGQFGMDSVCVPFQDRLLSDVLNNALSKIKGFYKPYTFDLNENDENTIIADENARNYSFFSVGERLYYRENGIMTECNITGAKADRIRGMEKLVDVARKLIEAESDNYGDEVTEPLRDKLNKEYDKFKDKFGALNNSSNSVFKQDNNYCLLLSLENVVDATDKKDIKVNKADIFYRRTISPYVDITSAETSEEALIISLQQKGKVDIEYMANLANVTEQEILNDLEGTNIFLKPYDNEYVVADEYLSGNVREKLKVAKMAAEGDKKFLNNVKALERVIPDDIPASEISVELGATWLPTDYLNQFMYETFKTSYWAKASINVQFSSLAGTYFITNKKQDSGFVANEKYGIKDIKSGYELLEDALNLKKTQIFDKVYDPITNDYKNVLNPEKTMEAQQLQEEIKNEFSDWIFKDPDRRRKITRLYNDRFNCYVARKYDGSHLTFPGANTNIELKKHQVNAVARMLYGGNSLLAHKVGAGKTFEMVAGAMKLKQLGLCHKSLICVPKHLTGQTGAEFLRLYPAANILVADEKDFTPQNRKKFCTRIATGNYDAIIIGHTQLEKTPLKIETQTNLIQEQLDEIIEAVESAKNADFAPATTKRLERTKKSLETRLKTLRDIGEKDNVIHFEELGVDQIFIDEAHYFKNLYLYTKMRNVAGVGSSSESGRAFDMYQKTKYLSKINPGRGIVFATGTPISNTMSEMYTMQRFLQPDYLKSIGVYNFDDWASTFGQTVSALELAPEGNRYRIKTRFAKFNNIPELMTGFSLVADIQNSETLKLPVPNVERHTVQVLPTEEQRNVMSDMNIRADLCRDGKVDPKTDNMLKITNDGRCVSLDPRVFDSSMSSGNKIPAAARNIYKVWSQSDDGTQIVFCDLSTPKSNKETSDDYCAYDDLKQHLIKYGIPDNEIQFMQHFKTATAKEKLFSDVRKSKVRVLIGSTSTMGTGTNVQDHLIALHHLDCPYRPADLEQREGRIVRQGNLNDKVHIFNYVTKETFDAYMYQTVENKQKFISQVMSNKFNGRSIEDIDETALNYAEIKALASGNPLIAEKVKVDTEVARLTLLRNKFIDKIHNLEDDISVHLPSRIAKTNMFIQKCEKDYALAQENQVAVDEFKMTIQDKVYDNRAEAALALFECKSQLEKYSSVSVGTYRGFKLFLSEEWKGFNKGLTLTIKNELGYKVELDIQTGIGNIARINNMIETGIGNKLSESQQKLSQLEQDLEEAKIEVKSTFSLEDDYQELLKKQADINSKLNSETSKPVKVVNSSTVSEQPQKPLTIK